jgi:hypothetical protein
MGAIMKSDLEALRLLWGAREIAKAINRSESQTFHLISIGAIKSVKKVGGRHVAELGALRAEFAGIFNSAAA